MNSKMQPVLILPSSTKFKFSYSPVDWVESTNISGKFTDDSRKKVKINFKVNLKMEENLRNEVVEEKKQVVHEDSEDKIEEKEEEGFSFNCTNFNMTMVSAEDVFFNGKIRPMFPIIIDGSPLSPPLKKLFIQRPEISPSSSMMMESKDLNRASHSRHSKWLGKLEVETLPEKFKKSNSIGFSKRWRFRELFHRSKYDGKDTSIFLNPPASGGSKNEIEKVNIKTNNLIKVKVAKGAKIKTASSTNVKYYLNNRAKEESDKRRSYLPYKLGFFADVNRMSKKVHAF